MFTRYSIFLLSFFLFSCNSKNTNSFSDLKHAYSDWYFRNHTTTDFDFSSNYFKRYNQSLLLDYIEDLNRFDLELSQINYSDLSNEYKIDFKIIEEDIDRNLYTNKNISLITQQDFFTLINKSFDLIIMNSDLTYYNKIELINVHLDNVVKYTNNYEYFISIENKNCNSINLNTDDLISSLKNLPYLLNIDSNEIILSKIDNLIKSLYKFKDWYNNKADNQNIHSHTYHLNKEYFKSYKDSFLKESIYSYDSIMKHVNSNIISLKNIIFDESLKLYLINNDEPIWVDERDSINVINWVIENKINKHTYSKHNITEKIFKEYSDINTYLSNIAHNYYSSYPTFSDFVVDKYSCNKLEIVNNDIYINLNSHDIYYNKYHLSDFIFENVISDYNIHKSLSQCNNSIRRIENKSYNNGVTLLLKHIFYVKNYDIDSLYKINFYLNLLKNYSLVFNQDLLSGNNYEKNQIIKNLRKQTFINRGDLELMYNKINSNDFYIEDFVIYLHLLNLYEEKCIIKKQLSPSQFINEIFIQGYIPYYFNK